MSSSTTQDRDAAVTKAKAKPTLTLPHNLTINIAANPISMVTSIYKDDDKDERSNSGINSNKSCSSCSSSKIRRCESSPITLAEVEFSAAEFYLYMQLYSVLDFDTDASVVDDPSIASPRGRSAGRGIKDKSSISLQVAEHLFKVVLQLDLTAPELDDDTTSSSAAASSLSSLFASSSSWADASDASRNSLRSEVHPSSCRGSSHSGASGAPTFLRYIDSILSRIQVILSSYIKISIANHYYDFMSQCVNSSSNSSSSNNKNSGNRLNQFRAILGEIISKIISEITVLFNFWTIVSAIYNAVCIIYCDKSKNLSESAIMDVLNIKSMPTSEQYQVNKHPSFAHFALLTRIFFDHKISTKYDYSNNFAVYCYIYDEILVNNIMIIRSAQDAILIELKLMVQGHSYSDHADKIVSADVDDVDENDPLMKLKQFLSADTSGDKQEYEYLGANIDAYDAPNQRDQLSLSSLGGSNTGGNSRITNDFFVSMKFVSFAFLSNRKDNLFELLVEYPVDSLMDELSNTDMFGIRLQSNPHDVDSIASKSYNFQCLATLDNFLLMRLNDSYSVCFGDLYHNSVASTIANRIEHNVNLSHDRDGGSSSNNNTTKQPYGGGSSRNKDHKSGSKAKPIDRHEVGIFWDDKSKYINILQILVSKRVGIWYFCQDNLVRMNENSDLDSGNFQDNSALMNSNFAMVRKIIERVTIHNYRSTKDSMLLLLEMVLAKMPWSTISTFVKTDKGLFAKKLLILINLVETEREECERLLNQDIFTNTGVNEILEKIIAYSSGSREAIFSAFNCSRGSCSSTNTNTKGNSNRNMKNPKKKYLLLHGITKIKRIVEKIFQFSLECRRKLNASAFSLVSQRKFQTAAGLFLLSEPPMISDCSQILSHQYDSPDLGFLISRIAEENYFSETFARVSRLLTCFCNLKSLLIIKKSSYISIAGSMDSALNLEFHDDYVDNLNALKISDSALWHNIFSPTKAYAIHMSSQKVVSMYLKDSLRIRPSPSSIDSSSDSGNSSYSGSSSHSSYRNYSSGSSTSAGTTLEANVIDSASDHYQHRLSNLDKSLMGLLCDVYLQGDMSSLCRDVIENIPSLYVDISNTYPSLPHPHLSPSAGGASTNTTGGAGGRFEFIKHLSSAMNIEHSLLSTLIFVNIFSDFFKCNSKIIDHQSSSSSRSTSCNTSSSQFQFNNNLLLAQHILSIVMEYFKKIPDTKDATRSKNVKGLKLKILSCCRVLGGGSVGGSSAASADEYPPPSSSSSSSVEAVVEAGVEARKFNPFYVYSMAKVKLSKAMIGFNSQLLNYFSNIWESSMYLNNVCISSNLSTSSLSEAFLQTKKSSSSTGNNESMHLANTFDYGYKVDEDDDEDTIAAINRLKKLTAGGAAGGGFETMAVVAPPKSGLFNFASSSSSSSSSSSLQDAQKQPRSMLDDYDIPAAPKPASSGLFNFAKASPAPPSSTAIKPRSMLDDF